MTTGRKPESEWERLTMFRELAAEFFEADVALSYPSELRVSADSPEGKRAYWTQLFRLMMLRKFFAKDDQVQLPKVAKALRACNHDGREDVELWASQIKGAFDARDLVEMQSTLGALLPGRPDDDPLELMLYGRLLHADAEKFRSTKDLYDFDKYILSLVGAAHLQKTLQFALVGVGRCIDGALVREKP